MNPKIVNNPKIILVGLKIKTSLSENKTGDLWQSFLHRFNEIDERIGERYFSVQIYSKGQSMENFTPISTFEKWAAIEVKGVNELPKKMESLTIPAGKYAVFKHKGIASDFFRTSQFIFGTWLPSSEYELDDRPHFEILGKDYLGPNDPNSEEDVYIPIR